MLCCRSQRWINSICSLLLVTPLEKSYCKLESVHGSGCLWTYIPLNLSPLLVTPVFFSSLLFALGFFNIYLTQKKTCKVKQIANALGSFENWKKKKCRAADWSIKSLVEPWALTLVPHPGICSFKYMTSMSSMTKRFPALKLFKIFFPHFLLIPGWTGKELFNLEGGLMPQLQVR